MRLLLFGMVTVPDTHCYNEQLQQQKFPLSSRTHLQTSALRNLLLPLQWHKSAFCADTFLLRSSLRGWGVIRDVIPQLMRSGMTLSINPLLLSSSASKAKAI